MTETATNLYEGMYILNATLSEEARKKALDRISDGIQAHGGAVLKIFDQGRKKLAYEIEGKREGYYFLLYFELPSQEMKALWSDYHLNEDLLRFLTLRVEEVPEEITFKQLEN